MDTTVCHSRHAVACMANVGEEGDKVPGVLQVNIHLSRGIQSTVSCQRLVTQDSDM